MKLLLLTTMILCSQLPLAFACSSVSAGADFTMRQYRKYRQQNEAQIAALLGTERNCHDTGNKLSHEIADRAKGLSCTAQIDANKVDGKMVELGAKCEDTFRKIHDLQTLLQKRFAHAQKDLEFGMGFLQSTPAVTGGCGGQVAQVQSMVKEFIELEGSIAAVKTRSIAAQIDYGKFKDGAKQLHAQTAVLNQKCQHVDAASGGESPKILRSAPGQGGALPPAPKAWRDSDISGVKPEEGPIPDQKP